MIVVPSNDAGRVKLLIVSTLTICPYLVVRDMDILIIQSFPK